MELSQPLLTRRAPISGYGSGRFRLGGADFSGSLLILPQGVFGWPVTDVSTISTETLNPILQEGSPLGFLILGTGAAQVFPDRSLREAFAAVGLGLDAMDTRAACRTYNVLLAEERIFAAALIALP